MLSVFSVTINNIKGISSSVHLCLPKLRGRRSCQVNRSMVRSSRSSPRISRISPRISQAVELE